MSKFKPIKRLGHQYGAVLSEPKLSALEIAQALHDAEMIEYGAALGPDGEPSHYVETAPRRIDPAEYRDRITEALVAYCWRHEYSVIIRDIADQTKPTDDPSDFGV